MKRFILFGELLCINETLSERLRYMKLLKTIDLLMKDKMSIEAIWKFYQTRRVIYANIGTGLLLLFILMIYHVYLHEPSDLLFMFPGISISYLCALPLVKPERNYHNVWDNKEEFVSLIRSNDIDQYMRHKESFWNNNISNNNERILTLTYIYKFNVIVLPKVERKRNPEYAKFWRDVERGAMFHGVPPEEFLESIPDPNSPIKIINGAYEIPYETFKAIMFKDLLAELKKEQDLTHANLVNDASYAIEISKLFDTENKFNHVPMENVIIYFDFLRKNSKRKIQGFEGILLSDQSYLRFIKEIFVENKDVFLNFNLPAKIQDQTIKALFYKFYEYNSEWAILNGARKSDYKQEKVVLLLSRIFERFKDYKGANFKPRNYHELKARIDAYLKENDIDLSY